MRPKLGLNGSRIRLPTILARPEKIFEARSTGWTVQQAVNSSLGFWPPTQYVSRLYPVPSFMRTVTIKVDERTADLWRRTLILASHERSTTTAADLLRRALIRERRAMSNRKGAGWIADVEAKAHRPREGLSTHAPPPRVISLVD